MDKEEKKEADNNTGKEEAKINAANTIPLTVDASPNIKSTSPLLEDSPIRSGENSVTNKAQLSPEKMAKLKSMFDTADVEKKGAINSIDAMSIVQTLWKEWYPCKP
jgi:hypothetical protein